MFGTVCVELCDVTWTLQPSSLCLRVAFGFGLSQNISIQRVLISSAAGILYQLGLSATLRSPGASQPASTEFPPVNRSAPRSCLLLLPRSACPALLGRCGKRQRCRLDRASACEGPCADESFPCKCHHSLILYLAPTIPIVKQHDDRVLCLRHGSRVAIQHGKG